jgi:hypothetical protein
MLSNLGVCLSARGSDRFFPQELWVFPVFSSKFSHISFALKPKCSIALLSAIKKGPRIEVLLHYSDGIKYYFFIIAELFFLDKGRSYGG